MRWCVLPIRTGPWRRTPFSRRTTSMCVGSASCARYSALARQLAVQIHPEIMAIIVAVCARETLGPWSVLHGARVRHAHAPCMKRAAGSGWNACTHMSRTSHEWWKTREACTPPGATHLHSGALMHGTATNRCMHAAGVIVWGWRPCKATRTQPKGA